MENNLKRAAIFCTESNFISGITLSGDISPGYPCFTKSAIQRLRDFRAPNLLVTCADFKETLTNYSNDFLYLDSPYANGDRF